MSSMKIIKLNNNPKKFGDNIDDLEERRFESTLPRQHTHNYFENKTLGFYLGLWENTDECTYESTDIIAAPYAYDEFMVIIEGVVEIKNSQTGNVETATSGNNIIIPQGYDCQWHQKGYVRKLQLIYQPPEEIKPNHPACEHVIYIDEKNALPWQATSDGFHKKVLYQSYNHKFTSGVWQADSFSTDMIAFPYNEFIILKQGSLICTDENGVEHKINTGEALFVPQGTRCSWQAQEKISLHFVQIKQ